MIIDGRYRPRPVLWLRGLLKLMFRKDPRIGPSTAGGVAPAPPRGRIVSPAERERLVKATMDQAFRKAMDGRATGRLAALPDEGLYDVLFATPGEPRLPEDAFGRLRWGGLFVYVGTGDAKVARLAEAFDGQNGFLLETPPTAVWANTWGMRIPGFTPHGQYFAARKTQLIQPGDVTDRFTYQVELTPAPDEPEGYAVTKSIPGYDNLVYRLRQRFPDASQEDIEHRARKFVDVVFPTFLTREAAFLKILQRDLPEPYNRRVPRLIEARKDERGYVHKLTMNWLRTGGEPMTQFTFAKQAAELLAVVHDRAKVMHLDLRLDNFVITEDGVGFVDFGSAVRIGENLKQSPMLTSLFGEMMRTSQIQRMLGRMIRRGDVQNEEITAAHHRVDKAVDSFYLAVQINKPHHNPEFEHLVRYDKSSDEARALSALTAAILRPKHPEKNEFKSAIDILRGIRRIEMRLNGHTAERRIASAAIPFADRRQAVARASA